MSLRFFLPAISLLASLAFAASCASAPLPKGSVDWDKSYEATKSLGSFSESAWAEDLDYLVATLEERHPGPWHAVAREDFAALLHAPIPGGLAPAELSEARASTVAAALASLGEAHTRLLPQAEFDYVLPIGIARGSDGFYVSAVGAAGDAEKDATTGQAAELDLLGGRLVSVNGASAEAAFASIGRFCSAENELARRESATGLFQYRGILAAAGLAKRDSASVALVIERGGDLIARELAFARLSDGSYRKLRFSEAIGAPGPSSAITLGRKESYWYGYLPESRAMLFQYNSCANMKDRNFKQFCDDLFKAIDTERPERLVIDLRGNSGGDSGLFTRNFTPRIETSYLNERGRLFVLTGPKVLSSGVFAAVEMRTRTRAIFVGEPTGEGPTHYGYTGYFSLPRSGLVIMHSTRLWKLVPGDDSSEMEPDILVPKDIPALLSGRDPCFEAALAYSAN
jgi:hypothetical protein